MKYSPAAIKQGIENHKTTLAVAAGVGIGIAATVGALKVAPKDLMASPQHLQKLASEGGRIVFDTMFGEVRLYSINVPD